MKRPTPNARQRLIPLVLWLNVIFAILAFGLSWFSGNIKGYGSLGDFYIAGQISSISNTLKGDLNAKTVSDVQSHLDVMREKLKQNDTVSRFRRNLACLTATLLGGMSYMVLRHRQRRFASAGEDKTT
ncbi:MAG: hypothetical protein IT440_12985 [Phycisphaeraceae bacterium]|nr:hypothetical protein [Phycisphaeraceae bacterium]